MRLRDIAISNLRVRKVKMMFLILGMVIGISTIVALTSLAGAMQKQLDLQVKEAGTRLLVVIRTEQLSLSYNGIPVAQGLNYETPDLPEEILKTVQSIPDAGRIGLIAPKLVRAVEISGRQVVVAGVDFSSELRLKSWWDISGRVPAAPRDILLGSVVAGKLGKIPGDRIGIKGREFTVAGIINETGDQEDQLVYLELSRAQEILDAPGRISFVELTVNDGATAESDGQNVSSPAEIVIGQLVDKLPQTQVSQVKDQGAGRREVVDRFIRFSALISVVVLFIGCLIIMTTMMSSVNERTREIGIFRAMGFRRSHIIRIILTEATVVSLVGGISGYLAGMVMAMLTAPFVAQIRVNVQWDVVFGFEVILLSTIVGILASTYPAFRAARMDPVEALRYI
ncbi:MAG: ABC transporter permease [Bacillota bacterium]